MIMKRRNRQIKMRILNRVCRSDQAADRTAPQGPPTAVPAAIPDTALPASTPAFTVAAARIGRGLTRSGACSSSAAGAAGGGTELPRRLGGLPHALQVVCPCPSPKRCSSDKGITSLLVKEAGRRARRWMRLPADQGFFRLGGLRSVTGRFWGCVWRDGVDL